MNKINLISSNTKIKNMILTESVYNFLDIDQKHNVQFNLKTTNNHCIFNYLLIINNQCDRHLEIVCDIEEENTDIKINFNVLIYHICNVFIKIKIRSEKKLKSNIDIKIEGVIDKDATLSVCPIFDFDHNQTNAKHSVKIGNINQSELYYLTSRGIEDIKAKTILTKSKINIIFQGCDENTVNKFLQLIDKQLEQNNEH